MILGRQKLYDGLAIGASALCLVHCLLLPVLIVMLPALAAWLAIPETFHVWALAFVAPVSALALAAGYRRHRWARPALIVLPGIVLLVVGAFVAPDEWIEGSFTVVGVSLLALGHLLNWQALRPIGNVINGPTEA